MSQKSPTDEELSNALNLIGIFCSNLPDDWDIEITNTSDEMYMRLINELGDDVSVDQTESALRSMVNHARVESGLEPV